MISNADVIRGMTDDELLRFLQEYEIGDIDWTRTHCNLCNGQYDCDSCRNWWLTEIDPKEHPQGLLYYKYDNYTLRTCATCGRASDHCKDGKTRCPIEEHYALPQDGRCHLWEEVKA